MSKKSLLTLEEPRGTLLDLAVDLTAARTHGAAVVHGVAVAGDVAATADRGSLTTTSFLFARCRRRRRALWVGRRRRGRSSLSADGGSFAVCCLHRHLSAVSWRNRGAVRGTVRFSAKESYLSTGKRALMMMQSQEI